MNDVVVPDRPLTLIEAAAELQVPLQTLRQLCKRKRVSSGARVLDKNPTPVEFC